MTEEIRVEGAGRAVLLEVLLGALQGVLGSDQQADQPGVPLG